MIMCIMQKKTYLFVLAFLVVMAIVCPSVSAGIPLTPGNHVLLDEKDLDFTAFSDGGKYNAMVLLSGDSYDASSLFPIGGSVNLPDYSLDTGVYVPFNSSSSTFDIMVRCYIDSPSDPAYTTRYEDKDGKTVNSLEVAITETVSFTLKGKPGATYQVFYNGALQDTVTLDRSASPGESFSVTPTGMAKITVSAINIANHSDKAELEISVIATSPSQEVLYYPPSDEVLRGLFAVGDLIQIKGCMNPSLSDGVPIYLYVTGVNLPSSGVNLDGTPVIDSDASSFTVATYYATSGNWNVNWDTSGFEPGTYTVYASLEPLGYSDSRVMSGISVKSQEYTLSDKSIHVKFAEENSGRFTQGDVIYSYWSARGSPIGVRWYIVGTNFLEAGIESGFPLYTSNQAEGINAPQGVYGFTYDRYFSKEMAPGNYYLIYQHPGYDNRFDVYPDRDGSFTSLQTTFGESADVSARPMENVAEVIRTLIKNSLSDDLYVISDITIESPRITIDQIENLAIGDSLKIRGTTNYAGTGTTADGTEISNTFSLKINRLDFELTEENAAMQMQTVSRVTPENQIPYYGERTYAFDAIDTSTWFEGTYEAVVTNVDTGFSKTMTFTVGGEGIEKDSETLQVSSDLVPDEIPDEIEDELLYPIEPVSIPDEPAPSSPGFILAPLGLAAAFILRRK